MIRCEGCQAEHLVGTLFCDQCGHPLAAAQVVGTGYRLNRYPDVASAYPARTTRAAPSRAGHYSASLKGRLALLVPTFKEPFVLPVEGEVLIGRTDASTGIFPELDLTAAGGVTAGVSRRHARIRLSHNQSLIEDLGSLNCTFLNRQPLTANTPTPFKAGDELRLGSMVLKVIELGKGNEEGPEAPGQSVSDE